MPKRGTAPTPCCGISARQVLGTTRIVVNRCPGCGTLWVDHTGPKAAEATWAEPNLTPVFLEALGRRRETQAEQLLRWLPRLPEPILDYGCGQAIFFDHARREGLDVWATDLSLPADSRATGSEYFVPIDQPWTIPMGDWGTVVLLDVLEHHPDPTAFLASLPAEKVVVKVPLLGGPAGRVALTLARLGRPERLEGLLLAGEANPHRAFFTAKGLERVAAPRQLVWHHRLADVGTELPERMTGRELGMKSAPIRAMGAGLAAASRVWSDTAVFVFDTALGESGLEKRRPQTR
jgi:hypothetical protein